MCNTVGVTYKAFMKTHVVVSKVPTKANPNPEGRGES